MIRVAVGPLRPGTFRAAGCGLVLTGTAHACGDGNPVPDGVERPRPQRYVPAGEEMSPSTCGAAYSTGGSTTSGTSPGTHLGTGRLRHPRYDSGMTQKIAVSLPDEQVVSIRRAVEQGRAPSVSGFISAAVARAQREDDLAQLLDDLDRELGPVDDADLAWADKALGLA